MTLNLLLILIAFFALTENVGAQTKKSAPVDQNQERGSDKVDIQSLEKKYWSAKDDDFSVVQNRAYEKKNRFFLSAQTGPIVNDAYSVGSGQNMALGYYFTERWGAELSMLTTGLKDNDSTGEFKSSFGAAPNYNVTRTARTLTAHWMPFYGKISLMDTKIVYFDMGLGLGVGQSEYEKQTNTGGDMATAMHYSIDVIQHYFFNEHLAVRFDFKNQWSSQDRSKYNIPLTADESARPLDTHQFQNTFLMIGLTYFH